MIALKDIIRKKALDPYLNTDRDKRQKVNVDLINVNLTSIVQEIYLEVFIEKTKEENVLKEDQNINIAEYKQRIKWNEIDLIIEGVLFEYTDFKGCICDQIIFKNCEFRNCKLEGISFNDGEMINCVSINGRGIYNSSCNNSIFENSSVRVFENCSLKNARINSCYLEKISKCDLTEIEIRGYKTGKMEFNENIIHSGKFYSIQLLHLENYNIDTSRFENCKLGRLYRTSISNSAFENCEIGWIHDSTISKTFFTGIVERLIANKITSCNFSNTRIKAILRCNIKESSFFHSNLESANLIDCSFQNVSFSDSNLKKILSYNCSLLDVGFLNVTIEPLDLNSVETFYRNNSIELFQINSLFIGLNPITYCFNTNKIYADHPFVYRPFSEEFEPYGIEFEKFKELVKSVCFNKELLLGLNTEEILANYKFEIELVLDEYDEFPEYPARKILWEEIDELKKINFISSVYLEQIIFLEKIISLRNSLLSNID